MINMATASINKVIEPLLKYDSNRVYDVLAEISHMTRQLAAASESRGSKVLTRRAFDEFCEKLGYGEIAPKDVTEEIEHLRDYLATEGMDLNGVLSSFDRKVRKLPCTNANLHILVDGIGFMDANLKNRTHEKKVAKMEFQIKLAEIKSGLDAWKKNKALWDEIKGMQDKISVFLTSNGRSLAEIEGAAKEPSEMAKVREADELVTAQHKAMVAAVRAKASAEGEAWVKNPVQNQNLSDMLWEETVAPTRKRHYSMLIEVMQAPQKEKPKFGTLDPSRLFAGKTKLMPGATEAVADAKLGAVANELVCYVTALGVDAYYKANKTDGYVSVAQAASKGAVEHKNTCEKMLTEMGIDPKSVELFSLVPEIRKVISAEYFEDRKAGREETYKAMVRYLKEYAGLSNEQATLTAGMHISHSGYLKPYFSTPLGEKPMPLNLDNWYSAGATLWAGAQEQTPQDIKDDFGRSVAQFILVNSTRAFYKERIDAGLVKEHEEQTFAMRSQEEARPYIKILEGRAKELGINPAKVQFLDMRKELEELVTSPKYGDARAAILNLAAARDVDLSGLEARLGEYLISYLGMSKEAAEKAAADYVNDNGNHRLLRNAVMGSLYRSPEARKEPEQPGTSDAAPPAADSSERPEDEIERLDQELAEALEGSLATADTPKVEGFSWTQKLADSIPNENLSRVSLDALGSGRSAENAKLATTVVRSFFANNPQLVDRLAGLKVDPKNIETIKRELNEAGIKRMPGATVSAFEAAIKALREDAIKGGFTPAPAARQQGQDAVPDIAPDVEGPMPAPPRAPPAVAPKHEELSPELTAELQNAQMLLDSLEKLVGREDAPGVLSGELAGLDVNTLGIERGQGMIDLANDADEKRRLLREAARSLSNHADMPEIQKFLDAQTKVGEAYHKFIMAWDPELSQNVKKRVNDLKIAEAKKLEAKLLGEMEARKKAETPPTPAPTPEAGKKSPEPKAAPVPRREDAPRGKIKNPSVIGAPPKSLADWKEDQESCMKFLNDNVTFLDYLVQTKAITQDEKAKLDKFASVLTNPELAKNPPKIEEVFKPLGVVLTLSTAVVAMQVTSQQPPQDNEQARKLRRGKK